MSWFEYESSIKWDVMPMNLNQMSFDSSYAAVTQKICRTYVKQYCISDIRHLESDIIDKNFV